MLTVYEYKIKLFNYHDEIVGRLTYTLPSKREEESSLYSLSELANIIECWRAGTLKGSFGIDTCLAESARFELEQA